MTHFYSKLLEFVASNGIRLTQVQQRLAVDRFLPHRRRIYARIISKLLAQSLHKRAHIFNRPPRGRLRT